MIGHQLKNQRMTYIIRWNENIEFPDGVTSNMSCMSGTREEIEEYANRIAKENNAIVEMIE